MKQIFLIGRKRTGIESIAKALKVLRYSAKSILSKTNSENIQELISEMEGCEVCAVNWDYTLEDIRAIEKANTDAVFILTEREPDKWYSSWLRFYKGKEGCESQLAYKNKGHYVSKYYEGYNHDIKCHFKGREWKFLNFYYGVNASWQTLCSYLKKPVPSQNFPHENRS